MKKLQKTGDRPFRSERRTAADGAPERRKRTEKPFNRSERPFSRDERPARGVGRPRKTDDSPFTRSERPAGRPTGRPVGRPSGTSGRTFTRTERPFNREERPYNREEKSFSRAPRPFGSDDRPARGVGRPRKTDDNPFTRSERPSGRSTGRPVGRPSGTSGRTFTRTERPFNREERPYNREEKSFSRAPRPFNRDDRPARRDDRPFNREERPFNREDKGFSRDDRPKRGVGRPRKTDDSPFRRSERPAGGSGRSFARPERSFNRDDRPARRDDRPFNREERPYNREERPYNREERSFSRDERPVRKYKTTASREFVPKRILKDPSRRKDDSIRLNKFIANSGICSRREADDYITAGLITVNGEIITQLGSKIKPGDDIRFNGERLKGEEKVYIVMNKPKDFVTTTSDSHADKTVMDLIEGKCPQRVYPVGRLDKGTTGVLLLTNDGELTEKLTHPSQQQKKIYHVFLDKNLKSTDFKQILEGLTLEDGEIHADALSYIEEDQSQLGLEIHSGRNRIVRRIFEHLGYTVKKLDRVYFAGLTKKNLKRGQWRFLTQDEVNFIKMGSLS